ncbi:MAG: hypothetical protein WD876_01110 [Candidatus Pacearchaeota archaeon]
MNKGIVIGIIFGFIILGLGTYFYYQSLYISEEEATIKVNGFLDENLIINPIEPDAINFEITFLKKEALLNKGIWTIQMQIRMVLLYDGYEGLLKGYAFNRIVNVKVDGKTGNILTTREDLISALNP